MSLQGDRALRAAAALGDEQHVIKKDSEEKPAKIRHTRVDTAIRQGRNNPDISRMAYAEMARGGHTGPRFDMSDEPSYNPFDEFEEDEAD